jgi:hypothetical protein
VTYGAVRRDSRFALDPPYTRNDVGRYAQSACRRQGAVRRDSRLARDPPYNRNNVGRYAQSACRRRGAVRRDSRLALDPPYTRRSLRSRPYNAVSCTPPPTRQRSRR